jgi:hypothetical protein
VVFPIFLVLFIIEVYLDIRGDKKISWRTLVLWAKLALIVLCFTRFIWYAWYADRIRNRNVRFIALEALSRGFGLALVGVTFKLVILFWLETMVKTMHLGEKSVINHFTIFIWCLLVLNAIVLISYAIILSVGIFIPPIETTYLAINCAIDFLTFVTALVILIIVVKWLKKQSKSGIQKSSKETDAQFKMIRRRTNILAIEVALVGVDVIGILALITANYELPFVYLGLNSIARLIEMAHFIVLFFFLENHTLYKECYRELRRKTSAEPSRRGALSTIIDSKPAMNDQSFSKTTATTKHTSSMTTYPQQSSMESNLETIASSKKLHGLKERASSTHGSSAASFIDEVTPRRQPLKEKLEPDSSD